MANINIIQKQFDGTDYNTLYPQTTSEQSLISNADTLSALGLSSGATVDIALALIANKGQIETGNYTGNGSTSKTLTFQHTPRFLWVCKSDANALDIVQSSGAALLRHQFLIFNPISSITIAANAVTGSTLTFNWAVANQVTWATNDTADYALNANTATYYYIAITMD